VIYGYQKVKHNVCGRKRACLPVYREGLPY
jgi:hypothetical protein